MSSKKDSTFFPAVTINGHVLVVVMVRFAHHREHQTEPLNSSVGKNNNNHSHQGVSGSGKSTLGATLAKALGCPFVDADDLHPQTNIDKMSKGEPLTDADRAPWLVDVRRTALKVAEGDGTAAVVACSALKFRYREVLRGNLAELHSLSVARSLLPSTWRTLFVHPFGPRDVLLERLMTRKSHFMGADMLTSQLEALENPSGTGEADVVPVGLVERVEEQVRVALEGLRTAGVCEWGYRDGREGKNST
jgi:gluconokinase